MAAKTAGGIYVPQTGTIYPSISAASKALGVDASNIGKVVRGARVSAGGYNFQRVDPSASEETLKDIGEALREQSTPKQRERMRRTREKNVGRLSKEERQRRKEKRESAKRLHGILVGVNAAIKKLEKENVSQFSDAVAELANLKAIIGANKTGGFDTSISNLMNLTAQQINAAIATAEKQAQRLENTPAETLKKKRAAVAFQFGLSSEELEEYDPVLPVLWDLLHMARAQQGNNYERSLYDAVVDAVNLRRSPEDLRKTLQDIYDEYTDRVKGKSDKSLDDILQDGSNKIRDIGKKKKEDENKNEDTNKDDEFADDYLKGFVKIPVNPEDPE